MSKTATPHLPFLADPSSAPRLPKTESSQIYDSSRQRPRQSDSVRLHRAIGDSPAYLNYAVWETNADFRAAFTHPEFRARIAAYPSSAVASPHLFQKVAVPGICVA